MHGLLQRRKVRSVPPIEARSPFWLPEPGDPAYPAACVAWEERANTLAVANGLPAVGSRMVNAHGTEWEVFRHEFAPSTMTMGQGIERGDDPRLLYPVVAPLNASERLHRMLEGVLLATPKEIVTLDTVPEARPGLHAPHSHSVNDADPSRILVFLDAARAHETAHAHELGHVWLDLIEDVEDHRVLEDLSETVRYGQVQLLQSFVLDFAVNDLVARKGFDMAPLLEDRRVMLEQMAVAVAKGYRPPTPWEGVLMATLMAEALVEADKSPVRPDDALARAREGLPEEWALSLALATAVREHPPTSTASVVRAVDRVLTLSFAHAGEHLDLARDLIPLPTETEWRDKNPDWLPGLAPRQKAEVGKVMARRGFGFAAHTELRPQGDATLARFREDGDWSEWEALPFRLPAAPSQHSVRRVEEINAMNRKRAEETMRLATMPQGPTMPNAPAFPKPTTTTPGPARPMGPTIPGRRAYSTGLGRWITQVRMEQALAGESAYGYALDNPTTYVDPSGDAPQGPKRPGKPNIRDCTRLGKGRRCYECAYKYYRDQQAMPLSACESAKKLCGSTIPCGPCGHYPVNVSDFRLGGDYDCLHVGGALSTNPGAIGQFLHDDCGGAGGADKLAHCFGACMIAACSSVFGSALFECYRSYVNVDEDPNDHLAEQIGETVGNGWTVTFGNVAKECLKGCAEGTKELPVGPLPGYKRW